MNRFFHLAFLSVLLGSRLASAADCQKTGSVCVDATPCRTIAGQSVCLSQFGLSCWEYEDSYTCLKPEGVNYCQPLADAGCWQTGSTCIERDTLLHSGCMKHQQTWRCDNPAQPTPANTIKLAETYTLISSDYDPGPCASLGGNTDCQLAESVCVQDVPDTPLPVGIDTKQVAPDGCYKKENRYVCLTGSSDSDCLRYTNDPKCQLVQASAECAEEDRVAGQCVFMEKTFRCETTPPTSQVVTDCSGQVFCADGTCFDRSYENDTDFARTMAVLEAAREAGVYNQDGILFGGTAERCKIKLFGLGNCCKKSSGGAGMSNAALFGVALQAGGQSLKYGSAYVYDSLLDGGNMGAYAAKGLDALAGGAFSDQALATGSATDFSPSLSMYGFSLSYGPLQNGVLSNLASSVFPETWSAAYSAATISGEIGASGLYFSFNPYMLAFQIAIMMIQEMLACDQAEQMLAMQRGQNLCIEIGTWCSKKFLKKCMEKRKSYCCYNSRLARIINEQGRAQIGKGWGSVKHPDCSGFTQEEFSRIDFSRIDLSEFMAEVMANVKIPHASGLQQSVGSTIQQKMQNYYDRGSP